MTGPEPTLRETGRTELAARRIYSGLWRVLVDWFRVPDEPPTLPIRPGEATRSFQPHEGFLRYLRFWFWVVGILIDIALTIAYLAAAIALSVAGLWWVALLLLPPALIIIIVPDIIAYIALHLRYDTTWYVMTDRSLRIRRGIWIIHEMTITFENVQNVKVSQGPLQRYFGISNIMVETAGGGSGGGSHKSGGGGFAIANQGVIEGVVDAESLRDLIMAKLRQSQTAGLGDEDDHARIASHAWTSEHLATLREIRDEVKALAG